LVGGGLNSLARFCGPANGSSPTITLITNQTNCSNSSTYLCYPDFDREAHPALLRSLKVSLRTLQLDCYDYANVDNPPILHRKESFLPTDYPGYETFAELSRREEEASLLENSATIGTRHDWQERLREAGMRIERHELLRS
jgi:DNA phosphorothioation-associated putative methyltransferase